MTQNLRKSWFEHVAKTRVKMQRGRKDKVLHRDAMREASISWPKQKLKIERKNKREAKKQKKIVKIAVNSVEVK